MASDHPRRYGLMAMVSRRDLVLLDRYHEALEPHVQFFMEKEFIGDIAPPHLSILYFSYPERYPEDYVERLVPYIRAILRRHAPLKVTVRGLKGPWETFLEVPAICTRITDLGDLPLVRGALIDLLAPHIEHLKDPGLTYAPHIGIALAKPEDEEELREIVDRSRSEEEVVLTLDEFYIFYPSGPRRIL